MVYDAAGGQNVHTDVVLTNMSVAYPNEGFVADRVAPPLKVKQQSNKYNIHGKESWVLEPGSDVRAPGETASEIPGMRLSQDTYFCVEHALRAAVTDEEIQNADSPVRPFAEATDLVTAKVMLGRELALRDMVQTAGNYPAGSTVTLSGTSQFSDYTGTSDPIGVFRTADRVMHAQLFIEPNLSVIPYAVMSYLEDHPDFIERIKYSQIGVLTQELVGRLLGKSDIIVPGMGTNTARMGQAESLAYIWGNDIFIGYVPSSPGLKVPAYAYEFVWTYPGGQTQEVMRWREGGRKADLIQVGRRYSHKLIAVDDNGKSLAGYLVKDAI